MTTYIKLQFNDNVNIELSTSSFLYKQSTFLQAFDINEDNVIFVLCPSFYVLHEHGQFLFNDKTDLSFMFTLDTKHFINVSKFLDIIHYDNEDNIFSKQFISYVMECIKEEIKDIQYFMQSEIRSIMNYLNEEDITLQIKSCTPAFYFLYLTRYKEEVIKYNRIDIYELSTYKSEYYRYINKYDNHLMHIVKETQEYNEYIIKISNQLLYECKNPNNINKIKDLIEQGANVNLQNNYGNTALHHVSCQNNNLEVIKYLVEHGANIHLQNNNGCTTLHYASYQPNNLEVIKYLVEQGANIHLQTNGGYTALHKASMQKNNLEVIKYLVEHGANIHLQDNYGCTALHFASLKNNNFEVIEYLRLLS